MSAWLLCTCAVALFACPRTLQASPPDASEPPRASGAPVASGTRDDGAAASEPAPAAEIEVPHAVETTTRYPQGGEGAAQVLLELEISAEGAVTAAKVIEGEEPFAAAARKAAPQWRFTPARRGGVAAPAKIRFLLSFQAEGTSAPAGTPAPQARGAGQSVDAAKKASAAVTAASSPETQAPAGKQRPIQVTVVGQRPEVALVSMGRTDVEQMPGAFGDPFRAIESLPGVTPLVSGLPFFFIRGAPPGNQGYFLDGVRVPLLFHMAAGPGIIHPALVERVDLYSGGYPAKYGRFAGAIVASESRDPPQDYHFEGNVRLVDSGAYMTFPFLRGSVALGGRYSYTAAIISMIAPNVKVDYWDYQAKTVQYLNDKDTVGIFAFGSLDLVEDTSSDAPGSLAGTEFHRIDFRHRRQMTERTQLTSGLTVGYDKTLAGETVAVRDRLVAARSTLEHAATDDTSVRVGADVGLDAYDVIVPVPDADQSKLILALPERRDTVAGLWGDVAFHPAKNLMVVPGLRFDHYSSGAARRLAIEPRVSAVYTIRHNLRIVHALGIAHQPPSFVVPVPGFQLSGLSDGLQRAVQSSAGVEMDLPHHLNGSAIVFQNAFFNLTDQLSLMSGQEQIDDVSERSRGRTYGLELSLRRAFSERIGGFLSYTLSKSWRTLRGTRVPAAFDRRHVLQFALAFNLGRNWRASSRFMFYSGIPSRYSQDYEETANGTVTPGPVNPEHLARTPVFWRTDLRLQKRWPVGRRGAYWAFTAEVLNTTLNKESVYQTCSRVSCRSESIGPITIPSLGVEAAY